MNGLSLKEIRDLFQVQYRLYAKLLNVEAADIGDKLIALWISQAQSKVLEELRVTKSFIDILVTPGTNTFSLPFDFGLDIMCEVSGSMLDKLAIEEIMTMSEESSTGSLQSYAVYFNGNESAWKITFAPDASVPQASRLWFYPEYGLYRPTIGQNQEWGSFDGSRFSGFLRIPPTYIPALMTYMLAQVFPQFEGKFDLEMQKYKQIAASQSRRKIKYQFGV